jgi:hypothetical protein
MKTIPLGPFLGVNNRRPVFDLHIDKVGDFLASGNNIDIDNAGNIHRRRATMLTSGTPENSHSLHMTGATTGYLVIDSVMYAVTLPTYTQMLFKVLTSNAAVSWIAIGDDLYYSNGTDKGRIAAGVWYPLGLPTPSAPTLSVIGGNLLKAHYKVSVAYYNDVTGEEGGISPAASTELSATGGIRVAIPASVPGATHINVYLSNANGDVAYWLATVAVGTAIYDCIALPTGREAAQRFEIPLPAGILFTSNNRLCSIVGNRIYIGLPWRHGYCLAVDGYLDFTAPVSLAVENQGGTYICADKTYWFPGDLGDVQGSVTDVFPYGAVPGTVFHVPDKEVVGWFGSMGIVLADTQGGAVAVMNDNIDQTPPATGTAAVFQSNGYMRVASCGWCVNLENKAATSYSDWDFTSISGGYGTKADGIYLLDTDGPVDAMAGFGKLNFGTEARKYLPAVYLGVNCDDPMQLRVQAPKDTDYTYDARGSGTDMQIQRVDPGRGLEANWFDLSVMNQNGADFTLASVSFAATASSRRI